jgi:undecaprenyl diphosphate synthase
LSILSKIKEGEIPEHVAIIMDGNGRWARQQGKERVFGHQHGVESVRKTTEAAAEAGVKYLTLYAFSTENWNRPKTEVDALMSLLVATISQETPTLNKNKIRLLAIGNLESLPEKARAELAQAMEATSSNTGLSLVLALSYSSRWEITHALKQISEKVKKGLLSPSEINDETISSHLSSAGIPDPELIIRTSGEKRISNFLLWQMAYSELYFTETLWPDFGKEDFFLALDDYQKRERRFGKTSEQVKT